MNNVKVLLELNHEAFSLLTEFLAAEEDAIAEKLDLYGNLEPLFTCVFNRPPEENPLGLHEIDLKDL